MDFHKHCHPRGKRGGVAAIYRKKKTEEGRGGGLCRIEMQLNELQAFRRTPLLRRARRGWKLETEMVCGGVRNTERAGVKSLAAMAMADREPQGVNHEVVVGPERAGLALWEAEDKILLYVARTASACGLRAWRMVQNKGKRN